MRLIDADALHNALKAKQMWVVRCGDKHNEGYTYDQVHFAIDDAPTIDAVEVVRCKDCIDNSLNCDGEENYCLRFGYDIEPSDFCSFGER